MNIQGGDDTKSFSFLFMLIFIILLCCYGSPALASSIPEFYYFNPDSSQANLSELKEEMTGFFEEQGYEISFQAFVYLQDFQEQIKKSKPAFILMPSWYFAELGDTSKIKPLFFSGHPGKNNYTKVLLTSKSLKVAINTLPQKSMAMTSMGHRTITILNHILFDKLSIDAAEMNIIYVPKDLDALIAVAIGQVDLALVCQKNIAELRRINPSLLSGVKPLFKSSPIGLPILCYMEGGSSPAARDIFKKILLNSSGTVKKPKILEMIQIDDWKTVEN